MSPITVNIWLDIACPWCYIGKRNFEAGLAQLESAAEVDVTYHSYELSPDLPADFAGTPRDYLTSHRSMPAAQVEQMLERSTAAARDVGLDYHFDAVHHTRTQLAHQALHFAKDHGKQRELTERLLRAYFTEGRHLGQIDELAQLTADVGLDADQAREALESGAYTDAVRADIEQAQALGVTGVPFYVIDGKYGISGAQPAQVFADVLTQVRAEKEAAS